MTVGEKLRALFAALLEAGQAGRGDPSIAAALTLYKMASRLGLARSVAGALPELEDEERWHSLLAMIAGLALELPSDGMEIDAAAAREEARAFLEPILGPRPGRPPQTPAELERWSTSPDGVDLSELER